MTGYLILFYSILLNFIAFIVFNCFYLFFSLFIICFKALWYTERIVVKGCINKVHLHLHLVLSFKKSQSSLKEREEVWLAQLSAALSGSLCYMRLRPNIFFVNNIFVTSWL